MKKVFHEEVLDLHRFLEDWLKGNVPRGNGKPERLAKALAEDFMVIHPTGSRGSRSDVLKSFAASYGEKPAGYALEVSDISVRLLGNDLALVTYVETHRGESGRERVSTVLMRWRGKDQPILWLFLQETPRASVR